MKCFISCSKHFSHDGIVDVFGLIGGRLQRSDELSAESEEKVVLPAQLPSLHLHFGEAGFKEQNGRVSLSGNTKRQSYYTCFLANQLFYFIFYFYLFLLLSWEGTGGEVMLLELTTTRYVTVYMLLLTVLCVNCQHYDRSPSLF